MNPEDRIIVALDFPDVESALQKVYELKHYVGGFKIGLELFYTILSELVIASDEEVVYKLKQTRELFALLEGQLFLDTKLADIPNTVAGASKQISKLQAKMFNVHCSSGIESIAGAIETRNESLVLAVTVLTSLSDEESEMVFGASARAKVIQFAQQAKLAGVDGIVCSVQEAELISSERKELKDLTIVTPGIRPSWSVKNEQKRVTTPSEAISKGSDFLVIGRPITAPPQDIGGSKEAAILVVDEIRQELARQYGNGY